MQQNTLHNVINSPSCQPARSVGLSFSVCVAALMCPCRGGMCVVQGQTPFWIACWEGHIEVVRFLAERKVDMTTAANNGPDYDDMMMMMTMKMMMMMMMMILMLLLMMMMLLLILMMMTMMIR